MNVYDMKVAALVAALRQGEITATHRGITRAAWLEEESSFVARDEGRDSGQKAEAIAAAVQEGILTRAEAKKYF